jgi:predicted tellurium resistance membrane protein TerC
MARPFFRWRTMATHIMPATYSPIAKHIHWAPYLAAAGIGVLSWIAFQVFAEPLGMTTELSRAASLVAQPVLGHSVRAARDK